MAQTDPYDALLPRVQKPSRYLGTELNSAHKDPGRVRLRACLAFPDSYDLGLGNLGLQILYGILNRREDIWAERVCAPHPDLELELRRAGLPLFALESRAPLHQFDLLGFTLQWELNYTNILNMLDLGGIPPLATERTDAHPIVIAGGPCVFNPEPLALFIDVFVIGDGEEVVLELAEAVMAGGGREQLLDRLAEVPGCYVPARFPEPVENGQGVLVAPPGAPVITKRLVKDLDNTPFPTDYLVPYAEQVHDRVGLEVLRGCTQSCRFCQAGMVTRPVRERSLSKLAELQSETMRKTGYEEISLVSLSTCDYSKVKGLVQQAVELAQPNHVSVSLPSLRLDSFSVDLADQLASGRKSGITFAPEAATDRMRAVINKFITREDLLDMSRQCFRQGWDTIKLYFMIGLPTETDDDVLAIGDLAREVWEEGRALNKRARINLGVSTFVPKPQTPFQWAPQIPPEETIRRQKLLFTRLGPKSIKFGRPDPDETLIEGLTGRGDRRTGWLIYYAWQAGARFDGWYEYRNFAAWDTARERWQAEFGADPRRELRERDVAESLPWDSIDVMIPKGWLAQDWQRARDLQWQLDCRREAGKCNQCGVIRQETAACTTMLRRSREGSRAEQELVLTKPAPFDEPAADSRIRFRWSRRGAARLLGHRETMNVFIRAIRRAGLPIRYSEGFHPHAALAFSTALPVGMETTGDWCDVTVTEPVPAGEFAARLNAVLPMGFEVGEAWVVEPGEPALMAVLTAAAYRCEIPAELVPEGDLDAWLADYLARPTIEVERRGKRRGQVVYRPQDIRPMVRRLTAAPGDGGGVVLSMELAPADGKPPKADEVVRTLLGIANDELAKVRLCKTASLAVVEGELVPPRSLEKV